MRLVFATLAMLMIGSVKDEPLTVNGLLLVMLIFAVCSFIDDWLHSINKD